jgi:hypothetical protein
MRLDHDTRRGLRAEISRVRRARLLKMPRGVPSGSTEYEHRTEASAEAPWFPMLTHVPKPAHRNLPSLDDLAA